MSTTLFFLIPIGLLAVAWSFCFVGCFLDSSGFAIPYSNIILAETGLVAYWPLTTTTDLANALNPGTNDLTMQGTLTNFASHPNIEAVSGGGGSVDLMGQICM